jgi:anti-sigma factor RsiW
VSFLTPRSKRRGKVLRCRRIVQLLADVISQELPLEYREMVEEHLRSCPSCAAFASSYRTVIDLARGLPNLPLPAPLRQRLRQKAQQMGVELPDDGGLPPQPLADDAPNG